MDHIVLFDDPKSRGNLLPFTFTRPIAEIRIGILKISEKWKNLLHAKKLGFLTQNYLQGKYPGLNHKALYINGAVCPNEDLLTAILSLNKNEALWKDDTLLAAFFDKPEDFHNDHLPTKKRVEFEGEIRILSRNWQIFLWNGDEILNATNGPIYIGKDTEVSEGSTIRGPFALCDGAILSMGSKIRENTTVGPNCKVGGEVSNTVFFGHSNKSHDGYIGNSVVGEWCNFGANTVVSNMKNNLMPVKVWDYTKGGFGGTGLQFCGSMVADHTKLGIGTTLNTGTVIGVGSNVFGEGFPRKFISSFAWGGGAAGFSTFKLMKFEETAQKVMELKGKEFDENERAILQKVFELTRPYRIWDKEF